MAVVYSPLTLTQTGFSSPIVPGQTAGTQIGQLNAQPLQLLGLMVTIVGNLVCEVQFSCDNPQNLINWLPHQFLTGLTASAYSQIIYPVSAVRLSMSALTGSGSAQLNMVKWP